MSIPFKPPLPENWAPPPVTRSDIARMCAEAGSRMRITMDTSKGLVGRGAFPLFSISGSIKKRPTAPVPPEPVPDVPPPFVVRVITITYSWNGTGMADLDTATSFLGNSIGWPSAPDLPYMHWSGDNQSIDGSEVVTVSIGDAYDQGAASGTSSIGLFAGWFDTAGGSGPASVLIDVDGVPLAGKTINPGTQGDMASTPVGVVTVTNQGIVTLS